MRALLQTIALLCLLATTPAMAASGFADKQEVGKWLTFYYLKPEPDRVQVAIKTLAKSGLLDQGSAAPPIFGWLSGVMNSNAGKVPGWIRGWQDLSDAQMSVVLLAAWYSGLPETPALINDIISKHPGLKTEFAMMLKNKPAPLLKIPMENGPWVIDAHWGLFMATGSSEPIARIVDALAFNNTKGDMAKTLVGGGAQWSLVSNAAQQPQVLKILEELLPKQPPATKELLAKVIQEAKKKSTSPK